MDFGSFDIVRVSKKNIDFFAPFLPPGYTRRMDALGVSALGLIYRRVACAAMAFADGDDALVLEHIYVAPDYRRRYFATMLLSQLTNRAESAGFSVLSSVDGGNAPALALLKSGGFTLEQSGAIFGFTLGDFLKSRAAAMPAASKVMPLESVPETARTAYFKRLSQHGALYADQDDIASVSGGLSLVTLKGTDVRSCMLVTKSGDRSLRITYLYLDPLSSSADCLSMLRHEARLAAELALPEDTLISADCVEPRISAFITKLIGASAEMLPAYSAVYK